MSLTNPNTPVSQQDLQDFYHKLVPYLGGSFGMIANKFNKGDMYSTDEKMIGQWTNGKPIYQKTLTGTIPSSQGTNYISVGASVDTYIDMKMICLGNGTQHQNQRIINTNFNGTVRLVGFTNGSSSNANKIGVEQVTTNPAAAGQSLYITVQYTKTTDSATSIGVDTDYSTTEKIVGTWIDGSPLYQRTVTLTMPTVVTDGTRVQGSLDLSSWNISKCFSIDGVFLKDGTTNSMPINTIIYGSDNTSMYGVRCYLAGASLLILESSYSSYNGRTAYVTLQYTKTS